MLEFASMKRWLEFPFSCFPRSLAEGIG